LLKLPLNKVKPNNWNCNYLTGDERERLKQNMSLSGPDKTPPIIVRRVNDGYEIIDGEQRWRIASELAWNQINAVLIEVDKKEAKRLCIGYNKLRGRVNWLKLCELLERDGDMGTILSEDEIGKLLELRKLDVKARMILEKGMLQKGVKVTLDHLYLISRVPVEYQEELAKAVISEEPSINALRAAIERLTPSIKTLPEKKPLEKLGKSVENVAEQKLTEPFSTKRQIDKVEVETEIFKIDVPDIMKLTGRNILSQKLRKRRKSVKS
jgi:ParB family chromosome partitioning protein